VNAAKIEGDSLDVAQGLGVASASKPEVIHKRHTMVQEMAENMELEIRFDLEREAAKRGLFASSDTDWLRKCVPNIGVDVFKTLLDECWDYDDSKRVGLTKQPPVYFNEPGGKGDHHFSMAFAHALRIKLTAVSHTTEVFYCRRYVPGFRICASHTTELMTAQSKHFMPLLLDPRFD